jgi:hypothetical protein
MNQEIIGNRNWMRWLALVVGLAGASWLIYEGLSINEAPYSWFTIPNILYAIVPLLGCLIIELRWPITGGALLIIYGLLWPIHSYVIISSLSETSNPYTLDVVLRVFVRWSLAFIIPGILFLIPRFVHRIYPAKNRSIPKFRLTGILIICLAGIFSMVITLINRFELPTSSAALALGAILSGGSLILLAVASWAKPFWGGILGTCYALLMIAFFLITQTGDRTILQMLSDLRYDIIPIIMVLIGCIIVLLSAPWRQKEEPVIL